MMNDEREEELEWNMAHYRLRTIGRITETVRLDYVAASRNPSDDNIHDYFTALKALYREIRLYMDEEPRNEISDMIDEIQEYLQADVTGVNLLQELEELDDRINEERLDAGLDIPSKTKLDPESALTDGLRDG